MANFNPNSLKVFNGRFDQSKFNRLVDQLARQRLKPSPSMSLYEGAGGTILLPENTNVETPFPFQISTRVNPSTPGQFQAMVNPQSDLSTSLCPNDNLAITGLGTWFPLIANDVIALYIVVSNLAATSATIQSYGMGNTSFDPIEEAWNAGDNSYVFNDGGAYPTGPNQIGINLLLAYATPDTNGNPYLVQSVFNHLVLLNCCIDGEAAIYPFPSPTRRYGITYPS